MKAVETGVTTFPRALGSTWALGPQETGQASAGRSLMRKLCWQTLAGREGLPVYFPATEHGCSAALRQPPLNRQARDQDPCNYPLPLVESEAWIVGPNLPLYDLSSPGRFAFGFKYGV